MQLKFIDKTIIIFTKIIKIVDVKILIFIFSNIFAYY